MRSYIKRPNAKSVTSWTVPALCAQYDWPKALAGNGVIAIVELGGGYRMTDISMFCLNYSVPVPDISNVSVDGTTNNNPGHSDADDEVALDIQVASASYSAATGKPAAIRMYWGNDITSCIKRAFADGCDVCSISWGADESEWGGLALAQLGTMARHAAQNGMMIFAAAGDNDSSDGGSGAANVDAPASAQYALACGGTSLPHSGIESVWNNNPGNADGEGTGGGFSTFFKASNWMNGAPVGSGRMVPDFAASADPNYGYEIIVNGQVQVVGGTSAVAPLFAGLFAAFGKKLAFVGPKAWSHHLDFNDITTGDNGTYRAKVGPDPCTGLGSPVGGKLAALFVK
jgi:kumamolisin